MSQEGKLSATQFWEFFLSMNTKLYMYISVNRNITDFQGIHLSLMHQTTYWNYVRKMAIFMIKM